MQGLYEVKFKLKENTIAKETATRIHDSSSDGSTSSVEETDKY